MKGDDFYLLGTSELDVVCSVNAERFPYSQLTIEDYGKMS